MVLSHHGHTTVTWWSHTHHMPKQCLNVFFIQNQLLVIELLCISVLFVCLFVGKENYISCSVDAILNTQYHLPFNSTATKIPTGLMRTGTI